MRDGPHLGARPSIGLVVNPIAGLGGRVGLKGTDTPEVVARALALGAIPQAPRRAAETLLALHSVVASRGDPQPGLLVGPGDLGESAARLAGAAATVVVEAVHDGQTTAADTRQVARAFESAGVDLLLFAGGDGTARDLAAAVDERVPTLGIPAGVKVQSAVFATSPHTAGEISAAFLAPASRRTTAEREVVDLDEAAYRRGEVAPLLHGYLRVPASRSIQSRKAPTPPGEAAAMAAAGAEVAASLPIGQPCVLGPGTTVRAVAEQLGVPKTLVGVDVVVPGPGGARLLAGDAGEREVRAAIGAGPVSIVVTPIGGQGFLFGRGNQPIAPAIIRAAGRDAVIVVATPAKLAALGGRPLLVDTGDAELDRALAGFITVITGRAERVVVPVAPA